MKRPLAKIVILAVIALTIYAAAIVYLDSRIPRATATVQVHPEMITRNPNRKTSSYMEHEYEIILAQETKRLAATLLGIEKNQQTEAIQLMDKNITTAPVRGTDFITITAKYHDPQQAVKIANAIAEAYAQRRALAESNRAKTALEALDNELEAQQKLVNTHKVHLVSFLKSYTPPSSEKEESSYNQAKELCIQSRTMLRDIKTNQQEARVLLKMPRHPITIHERAK